MKPQYICLNCKTVIGPIWDDYNYQCNCDVYEFDVVRVVPEDFLNKTLPILREYAKEHPELKNKVHRLLKEIEGKKE